MPPRAANKSSLCAMDSARPAERAALAAHGEGEHVAGCNFGNAAVGSLEHQLARMIETDETALHFGIAIAHRNRLADATRMGQPIAQNGGKAAATIPLRDTAAHCGGQPRKQLLWCDRRAMRPQVGRRETSVAVPRGRMTAAIDADANDDHEAFSRFTVRGRLALDENARAF